MRAFPRDNYLDFLRRVTDRDLVRIITGVRRCGKSTLLELYRGDLVRGGVDPQQILTINFEDAANDKLRDPENFLGYVLEQHESKGVQYLHVDEVQELDDWSRVINSLRVNPGMEICVTGSNATMFSGESLTYLAGRYIELHMLPLSLAEFRRFRKDTESIEKSYREWMRIGGFPAAVLAWDPDITDQINSGLFDSIFTRDIATRAQIRDTEVFLRVARFIFDNTGSPLSTNRISNHLKSQGYSSSPESVDRYLALMEDAHLIYRCPRFDTQGKQWLKTNGKYYFVDPGLRTALLGSRDVDRGHDLENMVYLELRRRRYKVATGHLRNAEIDFVATRGNDTKNIQVASSTEDPSTLERELRPLNGNGYLITADRIPPNTGNVRWIDAFEFLDGKALD